MLRPILFTFFVRLVCAVLNFLVVVLLSNHLGPEGKGVCAKYITIIANALIFCDFLGGPALVYLVARFKISRILIPAYIWSALASVVVMFFFMLAGEATYYEFLFLSILSFLNSCIAIHQNILSARMQFAKLNSVMLLQTVLLFLSLQYFLHAFNFESFPPRTLYYVWALGLSFGLSALLGFFFVVTLKDEGEQASFAKLIGSAFRYGFINNTGHFFQFLNQRVSYYLLNNRLLGVFSNGVSVGESVWMISNSIATVQYGKISNMESKSYAESISLVLLKINLFFCLFGVLVLALLPDSLFTWLFGNEFSGIHTVLLYLSPGLLFYSGYLILGHHFSGTGKFAKNLYCILTGLVFTISGVGIIYISGVEFTMTHAAIITSLAYAGNFLCALFLFFKEAELSALRIIPTAADFKFIRMELKRKSKTDSATE
jgi:O-antigen/teichoic acid export membrane protein